MRAEKALQRAAPAEVAELPIETPAPAAPANNSDPAGVINQVRELLFGETKRASEASVAALDSKLSALAQSMSEKFAEIEGRMADLARDTERAQASAVDDIGAAIVSLGASIRNMSGARKTN